MILKGKVISKLEINKKIILGIKILIINLKI